LQVRVFLTGLFPLPGAAAAGPVAVLLELSMAVLLVELVIIGFKELP
jgi:hypothetical protein